MLAEGIALYLLELWMNGRISFFINTRFLFLTLIGVCLLLAISVVSFSALLDKQPVSIDLTRPKKTQNWAVLFLLPVLVTLMGLSVQVVFSIYVFVFLIGITRISIPADQFEHSLWKITPQHWSGLFILCVPLLLGIIVPIQPLSTDSLETRSMNLSAPISLDAQSPSSMDTKPDNLTILDWIQLATDQQEFSSHLGEQANVVGFIYHDIRLDNGHFMVGRFAITCCVADAFAIGMAVEWPQSESLANNTWVNVQGQISQQMIDGALAPVIVADSVTIIDTPEQPYLYP
jgi:putative membrane protein